MSLAADFGPDLEAVAEVRCWTGSLLSKPLAAEFGPGPEAVAEGLAPGREIGLFAPLAAVFGSDLEQVAETASGRLSRRRPAGQISI